MHMDFAFVSRFRSAHTISWALLLSALIVALAATLGRATVNLRGALSAEDASLAVMLLLPEEEIREVTILRASFDTQEFLAETKTGPKVIRLKKGPERWFVLDEVPLRE